MKLKITGGNTLSGEIRVSGAKNAALKMIAAAVMIDGKVILHNTPRILDVEKMVEIFQGIGGQADWDGNTLTLDGQTITTGSLPYDLVVKLRGAVTYVGPLLTRFDNVSLPFPGGCNIGKRPLTAHIGAFDEAGVKIEHLPTEYRFHPGVDIPAVITLIERSVTATENIIMYLTKSAAPHTVTVDNTACEPEIDDLIRLLNTAGAKIVRNSPEQIIIESVPTLRDVEHTIIGDRIEAGTWIVAGLLLGDNLTISGFDPKLLHLPIELLVTHGADIAIAADRVVVNQSKIASFEIDTAVYPGFPTDLQSPFGLMLTQATGAGKITENLFDDRLKYLDELKSMSANIHIITDKEAVVYGPAELRGKTIASTDLRAGATFVLAGLVAKGTTVVEKADIIDRGYENIDLKLSKVGAKILRIE
jgi:UDP-N-acetylglucosamine 1-carboxyvinyltransferase